MDRRGGNLRDAAGAAMAARVDGLTPSSVVDTNPMRGTDGTPAT
jgi:hypothetical protein